MLKGVTVHGGLGLGILIQNANSIDISDTTVTGFRKFGISLDYTTDVSIDNVFVSDIDERNLELLDRSLDIESCVAFCSFSKPN